MVVGDTVMCYATKQKDKYDKRMAKVERLNTNQAVITMLEGLAQGEKRKVEYKWLELWPSSKNVFAGGVSSCESAEIPLRQALRGQMEESPIGASLHVQLFEWGLEHNGLMLPAHSSTFSDRCRVGRLGRSVASSCTRTRACADARAHDSHSRVHTHITFTIAISITVAISLRYYHHHYHPSSPSPSSQTASPCSQT